jgi:hypothetical protein
LGSLAAALAVLLCAVSARAQGTKSPDVNGDGIVDSKDASLVQAALGKRCGQAGFDPRTDLNGDCVVNVSDIAIVSRALGQRFPPTIVSLVTPAANANGWQNTDVTISFTCTGTTTCPAPVVVTTEGTGQSVDRTVSNAGGSATSHVVLNIDKTPPIVTATKSPGANANGWNNTPVVVTFIATDAISTIAPGTLTAPVTLANEGTNQSATGQAIDLAGNVGTATVTGINIDRTVPIVSLTPPLSGTTVSSSPISLTGAASDALSGVASGTCNGTPVNVNSGALTCQATLTPGQNAVTATVTDIAGNTGTATLNLSYLRQPVVTITSPANLSYFNISPTTVSGTVDDPTATVTINSVSAPVANGSFSIPLPLGEGPNIITATATAASGGVGTASVNVTLDTTPPHVTVTSPGDQFVTTDAAVSVAGNVNDIVVGTVNDQDAQVTVNGQPAQVANRTFLATNVSLNVGPNLIQVVARDRVGNAATTEITVTRKVATQSQIRLVSGNNQTGTIGSVLPAALVVSLTDTLGGPVPNKQVVFKVTQNDGLLSSGGTPAPTVLINTDAQGQARVSWTLGNRAGAGGNGVEAYSVGFDGTALFTATGNQSAPGKIVVDTGNDQIGAIGQPLPKPFIAVVVDNGNNRLAGVPVTFTAEQGGGNFNAQSSVTVVSDSDGRVAATLTLGLQEGNANNLVEADFAGNQGRPAAFTASGRVPGNPANTTISGVVLDNSNAPIPGVTVRAVSTDAVRSNLGTVLAAPAIQTDAQGQFSIPQAPIGIIKLMLDGSTASVLGTYPSLEYDMITVAGQANNVGQPIYLLPLSTTNQLCVTATTGGGTLTIPEAPGFSLTFAPGQVTFPGGSKTGCVSVTIVHPDKVPMVPGFGQQPRFIVTIQPAGAVFNPPAPITLPNVDGLKPREVTEMYSYDHDISAFVAIGTGIVSDDGQIIRSAAGVGVLKAGWHCGGNPSSGGTAANCGACHACVNDNCVVDDSNVPQGPSPECKKVACDNGSQTNVNDDSNHGPNSCCVDGQPTSKTGNDLNTLAKCSQRVQVPETSMPHETDGCTNSPQDPMRLIWGNPPDLLTTKDTRFGQNIGTLPVPAPAQTLPCNKHDMCYQTCAPAGTAFSDQQALCDIRLRDDLTTVCDNAFPPTCPFDDLQTCSTYFVQQASCYVQVGVYYGTLRNVGFIAFNQRQKQYCQCCQ